MNRAGFVEEHTGQQAPDNWVELPCPPASWSGTPLLSHSVKTIGLSRERMRGG